MKKSMRLLSVMLLIVMMFSLTACGGSGEAGGNGDSEDGRTIKIGFPAPLSGTSAGVGSDMEEGITLAIEDINARGGILGHQVELVKGDVEGQEPSTVTTVVNRLITRDEVDAMVSGLVNPSLVELDLMEQNEIPYILYGYAQAQERMMAESGLKFTYIHNAIPTYVRYQTEFPNMVEALIASGDFSPANKKVAVVMSQNEYSLYCGEGMRETFRSLGWEIVVDETIPYERYTEFAPILSKIKAEKPAVILYTDHTAANAATFMTSFLQDPTQSLLFLQATPSYPEFQEIMAGKQDGVIWNYAASLLGEKGDAYREKYKERWGKYPNPYGGFVYDAMMIMADAMEKSGDPFDKAAVNEVLLDPGFSYEGNIGTYRFDPETRLAISGMDGIPFATYQVWDAQSTVVYPEELAQNSFKLPPWFE